VIGQALALPLVAVVTPVYNGAAFLNETMDCVQAQTYGNVVHVLLDNASTDATAEIIAQYRDRRVPLVVGRNPATLDVRDNWEAAVRSSPQEARYFLVLCADDLITPDAIEKMVALAEQDSSIGIVACLWTKGTDPSSKTEGTRFGLPADISVFDGRWFVKAYLMQLHLATSPPCQLIRRDILDEIDPFYSSGTMMMDIDACLKVAVRRKVGFVYARLGFTRIHGDRISDRLVQPGRMFEANWLALIDRYGPDVMGAMELGVCRAAFLRYYFRRLLLWRFRDGNKPVYDRHVAFLEERGCRPTVLDYLRALGEWAWLALRNRRNEVGVATSLWPATWAELRRDTSADGVKSIRS